MKRRNFIAALLATVTGLIGCKKKKKVPDIDDPLEAWKEANWNSDGSDYGEKVTIGMEKFEPAEAGPITADTLKEGMDALYNLSRRQTILTLSPSDYELAQEIHRETGMFSMYELYKRKLNA